MKPIVGIVPLVDQELNSLWMLPDYMAGIEKAGGLPLMLPLTSDGETIRQMAAVCGGILFPGGQDVSPEPVSYTQLDVYKRQGSGSGPIPARQCVAGRLSSSWVCLPTSKVCLKARPYGMGKRSNTCLLYTSRCV